MDAAEDWVRIWAARQERFRREAIGPSLVYILAVGALASIWGGTPIAVLLLYFGSATIVALAVGFKCAGQFRAALLQTLLSAILAINVGPFNPFVLLGHTVMAMFFGIWVQLASDLR